MINGGVRIGRVEVGGMRARGTHVSRSVNSSSCGRGCSSNVSYGGGGDRSWRSGGKDSK